MRKLLMAAALALAGFLGLGASSAMAYTINCTAIGGAGTWPKGGYAQYCGSAAELAQLSADGTTMFNTLGNISGSARSAITTGNATFNLFKNKTDATTYYTERGLSVPAFTNAASQTFNNAMTGEPLQTFIFEYDGLGTQNGDIALSTGHEAGHWVDYFLGQQLGIGKLSNTVLWGHLVNADFANLNQHTVSGSIVNRPCSYMGGNGVFTHRRGSTEKQSGEFICNGSTGSTGTASDGYGTALNTGYSGANKAVLQAAWPDIYGTNKEIFAEEFVVFDLNISDITNGSTSIDIYFYGTLATQKFTCTQTYVKGVGQNGAIPTADLAAAGCPTT